MKKLLSILILSIILLVSLSSFILAQSPASSCKQYCDDPKGFSEPKGVTCICSPLGDMDIEELIEEIIKWLFYITIIVAPLMIIIGAFLFMTSTGEPGLIQRAKSIIIWSLVGLAVILFGRALISLVTYILSG